MKNHSRKEKVLDLMISIKEKGELIGADFNDVLDIDGEKADLKYFNR